jgi:hypothetical protein
MLSFAHNVRLKHILKTSQPDDGQSQDDEKACYDPVLQWLFAFV